MGIDTVTPVAKSGPLLVISTEYLMLLPGGSGSGESVMVTDKSDDANAKLSFVGSNVFAFTVSPKNVPNSVMSRENASTEIANTAPNPDGWKSNLRLLRFFEGMFFLLFFIG